MRTPPTDENPSSRVRFFNNRRELIEDASGNVVDYSEVARSSRLTRGPVAPGRRRYPPFRPRFVSEHFERALPIDDPCWLAAFAESMRRFREAQAQERQEQRDARREPRLDIIHPRRTEEWFVKLCLSMRACACIFEEMEMGV